MSDIVKRIDALMARHTSELGAIHDDFAHTRMLWLTLQTRVERYGENPTITNPMTGSVAAGVDLAGNAQSAIGRLRIRAFKDIVAQMELFVAGLFASWLTDQPEHISKKEISVKLLIACASLEEAKSAAIREAVDATVLDKMYGRPKKWFDYLRKPMKATFDSADKAAFTELKARRDVFEHHAGVVDPGYIEKLQDFGNARYQPGDLIDLSDGDIDETYKLVRRLLYTIAMSVRAALRS